MARRKSRAQLDRDIDSALASRASEGRGALRDLIRRARAGEEGAELVASDAMLAAGYSPERAGRALAHRDVPETVKESVRRENVKQAEKREKAAQRAALRPPPGAATKANEKINAIIHNRYFKEVPLDQIFAAVESAGLHFDPEEKACFLTGRTGKAQWQLFSASGREVNHMLVMTWHRMDTGRYEIVAYVS